MSALFITGTGTGIGKTFVTAGLIRHLRGLGREVSALKPVISGFDRENPATSDSGVLLRALGEEITQPALNRLSPWRFAAPLSPDMAGARENREIDFDVLVGYCEQAMKQGEHLFIEGVGGVMVPLDGRHTVLDWIAALRQPTLLVTGSYLGAISHTLTAAECLARRKIPPRGIVISETGDGAVPVADTIATLKRFLPRVAIATIPRVGHFDDARENFAALWDAIG
ncbi:MAG TPA: dethiobiotin synthase [Rhizomicrobium sp.]|nr:dethiobiotin synthase [Rhizomicrobium sp.]